MVEMILKIGCPDPPVALKKISGLGSSASVSSPSYDLHGRYRFPTEAIDEPAGTQSQLSVIDQVAVNCIIYRIDTTESIVSINSLPCQSFSWLHVSIPEWS